MTMRRSTISDVAATAGVSIATVSHALNGTKFVSEEPRKRVLAAAQELNYRPSGVATSLRRQKTGVIGLLLPMQGRDTSSVFFTQLADGIEESLARHGYTSIISNTEESEERQDDQIRLLRGELTDFIDGLIIAPTSTEASEWIENLRQIPVVYVDRYPLKYRDSISFVGTDNYEITAGAIQNLFDGGIHDIACISSKIDVSSMIHRYEAFVDKLSNYDDLSDRIIVTDSSFKDGYVAGLTVLKRYPCLEAIFVTNNTVGMGVLKAVQENGHLYNNIRLLIYDHYDWMELVEPKPDAISQPAFTMGKEAAELLVERISNPKSPVQQKIIPSKMIM